MNWNAVWIQPEYDMGDIVPVYTKQFSLSKIPVRAVLHITALGVYEAHLNGKRIGNFVLAPGWTSYYSRLQYQSYDITADLAEQTSITVAVGKGWYRSPMPGLGATRPIRTGCAAGLPDCWQSWRSPMKTAHLKQLAQTPPGALQKVPPDFQKFTTANNMMPQKIFPQPATGYMC